MKKSARSKSGKKRLVKPRSSGKAKAVVPFLHPQKTLSKSLVRKARARLLDLSQKGSLVFDWTEPPTADTGLALPSGGPPKDTAVVSTNDIDTLLDAIPLREHLTTLHTLLSSVEAVTLPRETSCRLVGALLFVQKGLETLTNTKRVALTLNWRSEEDRKQALEAGRGKENPNHGWVVIQCPRCLRESPDGVSIATEKGYCMRCIHRKYDTLSAEERARADAGEPWTAEMLKKIGVRARKGTVARVY